MPIRTLFIILFLVLHPKCSSYGRQLASQTYYAPWVSTISYKDTLRAIESQHSYTTENKTKHKRKETDDSSPVVIEISCPDFSNLGKTDICVSVTDADAICDNSSFDDIQSSLLLCSEIKGEIEYPEYYFSELSASKRHKLDMLMLTQGCKRYPTDSILSAHSKPFKYDFEVSQSVSGEISSTFGSLNKARLKIFVPANGYQEDIELNGRKKFRLTGLDFPNGTTFQIQVTNQKGHDKFIQLKIDSLSFPIPDCSTLSNIANTEIESISLMHIKNAKEYYNNKFPLNIHELPAVEIKGRRLTPMNKMKVMPDRWIAENDPLFDTSSTMSDIVGRLGLSIGLAKIMSDDGIMEEINCIRKYSVEANGYIPVTILLNNNLISGYEYEEISMLNPKDLKQVELFVSRNPLLCIYTNSGKEYSRFRRNKPLSMSTITQLGYKPAVSFYAPIVKTNENDLFTKDKSSTLYWNPHLSFDKKGKALLTFWPSSKTKRFLIKIEGVCEDGSIISQQTVIP